MTTPLEVFLLVVGLTIASALISVAFYKIGYKCGREDGYGRGYNIGYFSGRKSGSELVDWNRGSGARDAPENLEGRSIMKAAHLSVRAERIDPKRILDRTPRLTLELLQMPKKPKKIVAAK